MVRRSTNDFRRRNAMASSNTTAVCNDGVSARRAVRGEKLHLVAACPASHASRVAQKRHAKCGRRESGQFPQLLKNVDDVDRLAPCAVEALREPCKRLRDMCLRHINRFTQSCARFRNAVVRRLGTEPGNSMFVMSEALNCCSCGCSGNAGADSRRVVKSCSALVTGLFRSGHAAPGRFCLPCTFA